jgi:hypothetical protein
MATTAPKMVAMATPEAAHMWSGGDTLPPERRLFAFRA